MNNVSANSTPKRKNFTMVDNLLIEFGVQACGDKAQVLLLIMLMRYDHGLKQGVVYPSEKRLARQLGLSTRQVMRHLKALARKEFISINTRWEYDHRRNYYRVKHDALMKSLLQIQSGSIDDSIDASDETEEMSFMSNIPDPGDQHASH